MVNNTLWLALLIVGASLLGILVMSALVPVPAGNAPAMTPEQLQSAHPGWTSLDCARVADEGIWIGMTSEMARVSWGVPDRVNRTVTAYGVDEQWVYRDLGAYLYFDDGILTSWQN